MSSHCASLSTCMEDPLKVFHFTSVSWVGLGGGKTGFRPTFALFRPISDKLALCITLPVAFVVWKCCCGPMGAVC